MFDWLKPKKAVKPPERRPRGFLPTYVTDSDIVLCKSSTKIRNAYEIRLGLFFAVNSGKRFVLNVPSGAEVEPALRSHIALHGDIVQEGPASDYSAYIGHQLASGEEGDGWVLGDAAAHASLLTSVKSLWLKDILVPGATLTGAELQKWLTEIQDEVIPRSNIDDGNVKAALIDLLKSAMADGGCIFVQ
jgi:hypothetical protein